MNSTVNSAEARAIKILTSVLSTLLTPVAAAAGTAAGKLSEQDIGFQLYRVSDLQGIIWYDL